MALAVVMVGEAILAYDDEVLFCVLTVGDEGSKEAGKQNEERTAQG